ncbi:hypothetical protein NV560_004743 [Escherichia coli]|nr:hypothetical protein [Escherichia coli]EJP3243409.1 hypothetical protein [Escherichia coli]ELH7703550.1 hypothetical protein [Escherichia coli]
MKKNFEQFQTFITEQKTWFEQHLAADFSPSWDDHVWPCGAKGSGWLRGNGKGSLRFDEISHFKGITGMLTIDDAYIEFMKSMLVLVYRGRNRTISPAVATATMMILKRCYHALVEITGQIHPVYLTTDVIRRAMDVLSASSTPNDSNTANYKGRCVSLQKLINHQAFTLVSLQYVSDIQYTNHTNLTRKARETISLKHQDKLDDTTTNGEDSLITIRGFLNIVTLIYRVESIAEKIALNCLLLLVITGFRSVEAFNLRQDALVKRHIDDSVARKRLKDQGLPDYFLGIRYVGVKGAGERTHWVEPLAIPLVESIFSAVKKLTAPMRNHLIFLRGKAFSDYLPIGISNQPCELVELDNVVEHIVQTSSNNRGRAGRRDKATKALTKRNILPAKEIPGPRNTKSIYYFKADLSGYLKTEFGGDDTRSPCTHAWAEGGKNHTINYEDLLFIHAKGSLALRRTLSLMAVPVPFDNRLINTFLGNYDPAGSVFSKYKLLEDDGIPTQMRTHIPRHNINTFLAIAEVSDHLQAMLMGRVDITQNRHYQHLALAERRKSASLSGYRSTSKALVSGPDSSSALTPLDIVKHTGHMVVTDSLALDNNIKANLHTFDDRSDVAGYIEASFSDGLFEDIAAAFAEISNNEDPEQAVAMVERHAVLYPLKFGSCMRAVDLWGCPYRLKCQSMICCEHFTLTGRIDEFPNIFAKKQALLQSRSKLTQFGSSQPGYESKLANIEQSLQYLDTIQSQWQSHAEVQRLVSVDDVLSGEIKVTGEIRTLAQLFALEHKKLKQESL